MSTKYMRRLKRKVSRCMRFRKKYPDEVVVVHEDMCRICPKKCFGGDE